MGCAKSTGAREPSTEKKKVPKPPQGKGKKEKKEKKEEPWHTNIRESLPCGPVNDGSRIEYDDINKLREHFGDEFPRVKAVDIYTEGTFVYGIGFHYHGDYDPGAHVADPMPDNVEC